MYWWWTSLYNTKTLVSRFTDYFYKQSDGKLYKLMSVIADELQFAKDTIDTVRLYRAIDHAEGVPLDVLGAQVHQLRGKLDDENYRRLIKAKIIQNRSNGTLRDVIDALVVLLKTNTFTVRESWEYGERRPTVVIDDVCVNVLSQSGFDIATITAIIQRIVAAGVKVVVTATLKDEIYSAAFVTSGAVITIHPLLPVEIQHDVPTFVAVTMQDGKTIEIYPRIEEI